MKEKRLFRRVVLCALFCAVSLCLSACPPRPDPEYARTGEYFCGPCTRAPKVKYQVIFETEILPNVIIEYRSAEGKEKRACFQVDGYDLEKNLAYKMVTQADQEKWEKAREEGDECAPDLADKEQIQKAALKNAVPVLFVCVYSYQNENELEVERMMDNANKVSDEVRALLASPELAGWVKLFGKKVIPERLPSPTPKPPPKYWEQ